MAFFSNNSLTYDSQLRRKRSTSITSRERKSSARSEDSIQRKRTASQPSLIPADTSSPPALPAARPSVERPKYTGRRSASGRREEIQLPLDASSSFAKQKRRESPPPFSNLVIQVPHPESRHYAVPSSPKAGRRRPSTSPETREGLLLPSSPAGGFVCSPVPVSASTDASGLHRGQMSTPVSSSLGNRSASPYAMIDMRRRQSEDHPSSPSRSPRALQSGSPFSKDHARALSTSVSTPTSPRTRVLPSSDSLSPPPPSPIPRPSSATSSPTARSFNSAISSAKRVPMPRFDASEITLGSSSGSGSSPASIKDDGLVKKKGKNVLRKRSVVRQQRDGSTPDGETKFSESPKGKEKEENESRSRTGNFLTRPRRVSSVGALFEVVTPPSQQQPPNLTPAREVVVAYQESQRRSESDSSINTGGKVVAVGGPEDSDVGKSNWSAPWTGGRGFQDVQSEHSKASSHKAETSLKSLTRKLSTRLNHTERIRHTPNRRSLSGPIELFKATASTSSDIGSKRSVTSPVPMRYPQSASAKPKMGSGWPDAEKEEEEEGRVWEDRVSNWAIREQERGKEIRAQLEQKEDPGDLNPKRLWRLVKRLSSGNLKEKRHSPSESLPPVPALPGHLKARVRDPSDTEHSPVSPNSALEGPPGIMKYISSVPALAMPRARSMSKSKASLDESGSPSSPPRMTSMPPRRWKSTTTRSSSPSSSTHTGLFTRSRASSETSYGEHVPPVPGIPSVHVGTKSQVASPIEMRDEFAPSHKSKRGADSPSPAGSATIPSFDMQNPVNNFPPKKGGKRVAPPSMPPLPTSPETPSSPPPPVPKRSPFRITSPKLISGPHRKQSMPDVKIVMDPTPHARPRPSLSTPKARPRSVSEGDITIEVERPKESSGGGGSSMFTFRELNANTRHLTEQEKNAKWEDLLRKSAKAGGTLHVGPPSSGGLGLWSDRPSSIAISDKTDI